MLLIEVAYRDFPRFLLISVASECFDSYKIDYSLAPVWLLTRLFPFRCKRTPFPSGLKLRRALTMSAWEIQGRVFVGRYRRSGGSLS